MTPVVKVTGERASVNMITAITPIEQLRFDTYTGRFTAVVFIEFLESLLADTPGPVFIVVDNARQHTAKAVQELSLPPMVASRSTIFQPIPRNSTRTNGSEEHKKRPRSQETCPTQI